MKIKALIINDNHFIYDKDGSYFKGSKFHLFTNGFKKTDIYLSSPTINKVIEEETIIIDDVRILPRLGYGQAIDFYKKLPLNLLKHFKVLHKHITKADLVLLVAPACTLPISYFICRKLNKPLALYIVGDVVEVTSQEGTSSSLINYIKLLASRWEWGVTKFIAKRHTTFVLGGSVYRKLLPIAYNIKPAITSLVEEASIIKPKATKLKDPIRLLTVSRLSAEKGIQLALEAVAEISKTKKLIYTIIGDGPEMKSLKQQVSNLELDDKVVFTGYLEQPEIREHYLRADIFILPSFSEGMPKVILDAMATATPIISTRVGGIPNLLSKDQERGWLVEPGNIKDLELVINNCIKNKKSRNLKVLNANKYIKEHTLEKEADRIETELLKLKKK